MSAALTIDRRNLVDMESWQQDRIDALKRENERLKEENKVLSQRVECRDMDIEYLRADNVRLQHMNEELGRGY